MGTPKRKREYLVRFFVNEEDRKIIQTKMEMGGYKNMSRFLRQATIYDKVIVYDYDAIKETNKQLNKIGISINQIAARVNSTNSVYAEDVNYLKEQIKELWHLHQSILSNLP